MKIKSINLYKYKEAFKSPIITPKIELTERESLFIEIVTHDDQTFYGECNAFDTTWYADETILTVQRQLKKWIPQVIDKNFATFESWLPFLKQLEPTPATRATVVMAIFQMYHQLFSFEVEYGATVNGLTPMQLDTLKKTKPKRVKLKWSPNLNHNLNVIRALNLNNHIAIDANESLSIDNFSKIKQLNTGDIIYIEEPFKLMTELDLIDLTNYPAIAIDEKASSIRNILSIINEYPIEVVVLKPFRLGGIDKMLEIIEILKKRGIQFVVGGMYEFGLSRYFTAMLAKEGDCPGDVTPQGYYFYEDIVNDSGILKEGLIYFNPPQVNQSKLKRL